MVLNDTGKSGQNGLNFVCQTKIRKFKEFIFLHKLDLPNVKYNCAVLFLRQTSLQNHTDSLNLTQGDPDR